MNSKTPGRSVIALTPGGFEAFFADAVACDRHVPPDPVGLQQLNERYGVALLGPRQSPA